MDLQTTYKEISIPKTLYENYIEDKLEQDLIIPDYYCSAQKIIHCEASTQILSKNISEDKIVLEGRCIWRILYQSDEDNALHHISCEKAFTEIFSAPDVSGNIRYKIKAKNVYCKLLSATKAECKSTLCIAIKIDGKASKKMLVSSENKELQLKIKNTRHFQLETHFEKEFHIIGEILLKRRNEYDVYKSNAQLIVKECRCYDGKVAVKGICKNSVILLSGDTCQAETAEIETPFVQMIESDELCENWYAYVHCEVVDCDVSFVEESGEEALMVKNNIVANVDAYSSKEVSACTDAYHTQKDLNYHYENIEFNRDIQSVETLTHMSHKIHMDTKDMSVLFFESRSDIVKIDVQDAVMIVDGSLEVDCLYTSNENVSFKTFTFPFQVTRQLEGNFDRLKCDAQTSVDNFNFIILNDNELEISCDCRTSMAIYIIECCKSLSDLGILDTKSERVLKTPMVIYYGSKNESLWEICKEHSVPIQAVRENNDLFEERLSEDRVIFITKQ